MSYPLVDTDLIIRLLTGDDPEKQEQARRLFKRVEGGQLTVTAPDTVIADAVFVLASKVLYNKPRPEIRALLRPIVRLRNFRIEDKAAVLRALDIYATSSLDFGDAMVIATGEQIGSKVVYSYDRDFAKFGMERREPE